MKRVRTITVAFAALAVAASLGRGTRARANDGMTDTLVFGAGASERAHAVTAGQSETTTDRTGEPVRRLLPVSAGNWQGGRITFRMKVNPDRPNYFTARFSGDETNDNRLVLIADGKQIGWRHLGEVDQLDFGTWDAAVPGRFYYNTSPLPESITHGKTEVQFEIRASGRIWPYGTTFEKFQYAMSNPSRELSRVYTHVDGFFQPPAGETQGTAPSNPSTSPSPGVEVLDAVKKRVNDEIEARLKSTKPLSQTQYLYESVGLLPWRDSDAGGTSFHFGNDYWQLTDKCLTRELGYVGTDGEVIDLVGLMYEATKPAPDRPGGEKIRAQLVKAAKARSHFRYPEVDAEGHRVMRLEQIIGWRDLHFPGEVAYAQRATHDASVLQAAALTLDPDLVAYAQQMLADNQCHGRRLSVATHHDRPTGHAPFRIVGIQPTVRPVTTRYAITTDRLYRAFLTSM